MYKTCIENYITWRKTGYKCDLCCKEIQEHNFNLVNDHIQTDEHQKGINNKDKNVKHDESRKLKTCSRKQLQNIFKNQITSDIKKPYSYYCHICKCSICGISNSLNHINGSYHMRLLVKMENIEVTNGAMPINSTKNEETHVHDTNKQQVANLNKLAGHQLISYVEDKNLFRCVACKCTISAGHGGNQNLLQHIQGFSHKTAVSSFLSTKNSNKIDNNKSIQNNASLATELKSYLVKVRYCLACQIFLKDAIKLQTHVMAHLYNDLNITLIADIIKYSFQKKGQHIIKCLLCNEFLNNCEMLEKHIKTKMHTDRITFFSSINTVPNIKLDDQHKQYDPLTLQNLKFKPLKHTAISYLCTLCDVLMSTNDENKGHIKGKKHMFNVLKASENKNENISYTESLDTFTEFYVCHICQESFSDALHLFQHYSKIEHKVRIECFQKIICDSNISFIEINNKQMIYCNVCDNNMSTCNNAIEHILGKKHKSRIAVQSLIEPSLSESLTVNDEKEFQASKKTLGFSTENSIENIDSVTSVNSDSLDIDDVLNDLINLDLTNSQLKRLAYSSRKKKSITPKIEVKKNVSSFHKNVNLYGPSFIKHSICSGVKNIYTINSEKLRTLKIGTSLIFPWESQHACIVCADKFPDQQALFEHLQDEKHIQNLYQMENDDKEFEGLVDQYSDLNLAKNYMQDESDELIYCYACQVKVRNDDHIVRLHIEEPNHFVKSKLWKMLSDEIYKKFCNIFEEAWYYAQVFICEICKEKSEYEIDFVIHLETSKHIENVKSLSNKGIVTEFGMCPVCITYWYGKSDSYSIHCQSIFHKRFANSGDFMVPNMTATALNLLINVDERIDLIRNESNKVILEKFKETQLLQAIEETVECIYPNAKAYTFGSRLSDLGFVDSDLDVFLDCNNCYKSTDQERKQKHLLSIKEYFEKEPNTWIIDEVVLVTRVPILKLRHIPTGLKCDISCNNGLSVEKSKLIGFYTAACPICRDLILYLKKWLSFCQITGSNSITTFAISWYVIFYLQIKGILPPVIDLIQLKNESSIVDGWECGYADNFLVTNSDLNFQDYLQNFFLYYANFNYKTDVACPYLGQILKKYKFAYTDQLPEEMNIYKSRVKDNDSEIFRFDSPMCIQDPVDLSQNITKAVKKLHLRCFRQYCAESATKLSRRFVL